MSLQCWDDPAAKTMTLVVGNHKLPGAGFLLYRIAPPRLVSATYYGAAEGGKWLAGVDVMKRPGAFVLDTEGGKIISYFYPDSDSWPRGGQWRVVIKYPD
jgi:hypothetical protein